MCSKGGSKKKYKDTCITLCSLQAGDINFIHVWMTKATDMKSV